MKRQNEVTPFIRQCVKLWLSDVKREGFTVTDVCNSLYQQHEVLADLDLTKAVSNELLRLEAMGVIHCDGVEALPIGRPAKRYRQKWCSHTLEILKGPAERTMIRFAFGVGYVFVRGQGYTPIFPGYELHRKSSVKTLIEHHDFKIKA